MNLKLSSKSFLFWEILFSTTLCVVVCGRADKANMLEVSGQLPGQLVLPRVIIVMPNNGILSKIWNGVSGPTFPRCYLSFVHVSIKFRGKFSQVAQTFEKVKITFEIWY